MAREATINSKRSRSAYFSLVAVNGVGVEYPSFAGSETIQNSGVWCQLSRLVTDALNWAQVLLNVAGVRHTYLDF